jgi:DNA gyrase subunit B
VDNSIDESLAGYCSEIKVKILPGNVIEVSDNGRGIPVGVNHKSGISAATMVYTVLHAGGKFGGGGYKVSGGLHGVGASVVNALSEKLELFVSDGENLYYQEFHNGGKYDKPIEVIGDAPERGIKGTIVRFKPDPTIFSVTEFNYRTLFTRLREQAFLNAGLVISITDERDNNHNDADSFCYDGGIISYVEHLDTDKGAKPIHDEVIYLNGMIDDVTVEAAFRYNDDWNGETIRSFANNIHTLEGGVHENAFKRAIVRVVNDFAKIHVIKENEQKRKKGSKSAKANTTADDFTALTAEAIREAINAIVTVKLSECEFEGQTKAKLGNPGVGSIVYKVITEKLTYYFETHPETATAIVIKSINSQSARDAARKAAEAKRKSVTDGAGLPGKLWDCYNKNPEETEIYIVEGDSAGGTAKLGRDSNFQAILPLWGKMLNVEKARPDAIYGNDKLSPVVKALGTGLSEEYDKAKLRYGRVVIMADADVDGSHIRTLLLTFFFRFMRPLIEDGHVFIAQPPLFKVFKGKQSHYAYSDDERDKYIREINGGDSNVKVEVQRYKGLGEMDKEQLWDTTMNPETRIMIRVDLSDAAEADTVFSVLMGEKVEPRREFIEKNAKYVTNLDI